MRRKGTSFVALVALLASGFTFLEAPASANAAIVTSNLVVNLDASNTSSMAASSPTGWKSVSPATSTDTGTFFGNAARVSDSTGASMSMDGNGDAVVFPVGVGRSAGSMTVDTWIKPGNLRIGWNIFASRWFGDSNRTDLASAQDWHFAIYGTSATNLKLQLNTGAGILTSTSTFPAVGANKWYHVAFTIDAANNNTATLWINGVAEGTVANFPHTDSATAQLQVGDVGTANTTSLLGNMSRFRIYNAALTSTQIAQNYLADSANYGYAPVNTVAPSVTGTVKVGTVASANVGTWGVGDADGTTTAYQWQSSTNGSTWTNITGATSATYTPVANDVTNYLRVNVTKTNSAGNSTATSAATLRVQASAGTALLSGGKLTGLTSTVPNDATVYNVTIATSNLSATMQLGTTTGLTVVTGYASTASYMASTVGAAAPIISFRGAGTAINTALANITYTSATKQVDVVKLYYATAGTTSTDTKDYIPIYDNNQLTFHYYAYKSHASSKDRTGMDAALVGLTTTDNVQAPGPWYLFTPRYQVEWDRVKTISGLNAFFMGAKADAGSTNWYWPANTDGYSSATNFGTQSGTVVTATSNVYNQTNTTLPFHSGEPNGGTTVARSGYIYVNNSALGWDDVPADCSCTANFVMETYGTAPFNSGAAGSLAQTVSVVANAFDAPANLTVEATGTNALAGTWSPVTPNITGLTLGGYRLEYSTSSSFSPLSVVITQPTVTSAIIPGLTANTTYYVRVLAAGSTWGAYSPAVTVTTKSAATTINIVSSGGGVAGTDYTLSGGQFYAKSSNTVNINASDIQTALNSGTANVVIAADNVIVDAPITWTSARYLTLGNSSTSSVTINKTITSSANFAQLLISPSTYNLDVKNGASIRLTSAGTQYLSIGGTAYTLIKTEAQLAAATTVAGNYAIANPITLVNTYTAAPMAISGFSGKLDGLGNTVDSMKLNVSATSSAGLVQVLSGGTIRNLGVTNISATMTGTSVMANIGGIVGQSTGGTLDQVWSTGFLTALSGASSASVSFGGLIGNAGSGSTAIQKSWSSLNISTAGATSISNMTVGGLVGSDVAAYGQQPTASGGNITMNQVYATGDMATGNFNTWRGHGGLIGLHYSTASLSITDAFIWSNLVTTDTAGIGGLIGNSGGSTPTITNAYTVHPVIAYASVAPTSTNVQVGIVAGAAVSAQNGANWVTDATNGTYLRNVAKPFKNLYAQVVAPANGAYSGISTQLVDGAAQVQSLATMNLSTSGTPVYTILSNVAKGTYNVSYVSGLTLGGTAAGPYTISPWPNTTSVTISRLAQTFTWAPNTAISFGSGTFTPSAAPVSSASSTISYAVTSAGTTGCTVNATTGVVTYTAAGSCEVTATAAQTTDYTAATVVKTFVIAEASTAPTVTATAANTTAVALSWTTPTVNASAGLTGYQILYSTSSSMTSATIINTGNTDTRRLITGLTAGTTYYFQVRAVSGTTWYGSVNAVAVSGSPKAATTSITVVASGGGTAGTDFFISGGNLYTTNASANVNVADIQNALLTGGLNIAAENVTVNTAITWATSQVLTLGNTAGGSVAVNNTITASGVSGGLVITPTSYTLKVNTGAEIILSGASSTLSIGGNVYTLIRSTSDLSSVTATGNFALAQPIAYLTSATTLSAAPINVSFTGVFDGLGNNIDRLNISASTTGNYGLFSTLASGGTIRNLGVTNGTISLGANTYKVGMIAGGSTGGTIDQVWSTGLIKTTTTNAGSLSLGGLVGNASAGTLNISKSWSSANINSSTSGTATALEQGGIIGGNEATVPQASSAGGAMVNLNQVYATGTLSWASNSHRGIGGLFGLHYNSGGAQTITDSFSWVTFAAGVPANNFGGIIGVAAGSTSTVTRSYQTTTTACVAGGSIGFTATPNCDTQQTAGSTVTGISGAAWASANGTTLANVATPTKQLFVKVNAPGNLAYSGITYSIVDGNGTAVTLSSLNLTVSGTPVYTIASDVLISATPYKVDYVSGLTLGGTAASLYSLAIWPEPTSVTISKYPQTITWTPTTSIVFGSGTVTPTAASASGGTAITYAVTSAGTTGCTVNSTTGAITYTRGGDCAITATAANSGNYLGATTSAIFTIAEPATAPTASVVRTGTGALSVGWTAPTVNSSVALTGYQVFYSTSPTMAPAASVTVGNTRGWLTTGLTNGTTYYFQVRAISGSTWTGPLGTVANGSAASTATTINVVTSGGGVAGTNYTVNGGVISTTGTASINAADINAILATEGTVHLAADTVNVNGTLSWSSNAVLALGNTSSSTVNVNSTIAGSGATAGVKILPSSYGLLVKSGAYIRLTGATPTFNVGVTAYTVVNTVAGLANVAAGTTWALTAPITLSSNYTTAVKDFTYTGIMDGLGNTISNMQITVSATRDAGFFASLGGATIRNVGFTNVNISSATDAINTRLGSVAGNGSSAGTNTVSQVWATGFINQTAAGTSKTEVGGLFGGATAGTLNITKSWSSVAISTKAPSVGSGGIIGTNVGSFGGGTNGGNTLSITESYSTGNVLRDMTTSSWYGNAGIIGVAYGTSTTITNVFAWGNINSTGINIGTSTAGISGVGTATITNAYTTYSSCGGTATNCLVNQTAGAVVSGGTGFTTGLWQSVNGTSLVNLTPPTKNLYVKVAAPTDGSYGTMSYQIVDSTGTVQTLSSLNLSVTGSPVYTIASNVARGTYSVAYSSGLTLGGTSAAVYSLNAWITNTSVTITRLAQTVTWAPTTAIPFKTGTFTPSALATALGTPTITYAVTGQGTTGCTVNSATGVVTYYTAGTCTVTATAAQTTDYLAGTAEVSFVIAAAPTFTIVTSGGGISGTDYTVSGGVLSSVSNVSINVADLTTLLASGSVQLAGSVIINTPITWSANTTLTLGGSSGNTVTVNKNITATGASAGLVIKPATYALDTKTGAAISLSGATPSLSIGGTSYTLVKSIADLANVTALAADKFALAVPLSYSSTLSAAPISVLFAGTFDGLGNTVDKLSMTQTGNGALGFFKAINGATIRNLGITNQLISLEPASTTYANNVGGVVGESGGGSLEQVWSTGFARVKTGSTYNSLILGGLVGNVYGGTLTITKSWSSMGLNTAGSTYTNQATGGLVGADISSFTATSASASGNVTITQSYFTGDIRSPQTTGITGLGGILGAHLGTGAVSIIDAFSWGYITIATGGQYGGIIGTASGSTANFYNTYTNTNRLFTPGSTVNADSNSSWSVSLGATPGFVTNSNWYASANGRALVNLPMPYKNHYIRVVAPTDGSYSTMSYKLVFGTESDVTLSPNFTITGTPTYSIGADSLISATPYNVNYVAGLTISYVGTGFNVYRFLNFGFPTAVTISKYSQTISLTSTAPTSAAVGATYTLTGSASSGLAVAYTIDSTATSICSISAAVVTFNALGTCKVNANQAGNTSYLAAPQVQQSITVDTKGSQTISFTSTAPAAKVAGASYTPTATATSGVAPVLTIAAGSSSVCSIESGVVSFLAVGSCVINANEAGGANWNAATQVQQTVTVAKGISTIVITSAAPTNAVVGGATYTLTSTKTAANTNSVTYSVDSTTSTICSVDGAVVSFLLVGTCKVNANLASTTQYEAADQQQQVITVGKGSQTLAFTSSAPNAAKVGAPNYTVTATGGASTSAIVLTVDSSATTNCSVTGFVVTYLAVGDCVLNLNQAGDINFTAATQVQQTVTITSDGRCPNGVVSGNYCLVKFTSDGSWKVPAGVTSIDVVVVGAGGAGGGGAATNAAPGGGGGGEVLETLGLSVTPGTVISASIGAGGVGGGAAADASASTNGGATTLTGTNGFTTITSRGGGAGATWRYIAPSPGLAQPAGGGATVAGGGGGHAQVSTRVTTAGIGGVSTGGVGNPDGTSGSYQNGGGGGGAGGNGGNASAAIAGAGGVGKTSVVLGVTLGGGGGGAKRAAGGSLGAVSAGGGAGGIGGAGTAGTANTGGGGGGSAGSNNGAAGGSGVAAIRFAMTSQTVAFTSTAPAGLIFGTSTTYTPTISATASEVPGTISVDSSSSSVCSITAGVVSVIGAGTCTLNANQEGNGFYSPATQVQQSFTVAKQNQTISFTSTAPTNAVVDGSTYTVTGTSTSSAAVTFSIAPASASICTVTSGVVSFHGAGTCTVLANQTGDTNWNAATQVSQAITVGKGTQVITFTSTIPSSAAVGGSTYTVTATGGASDNARVFASTTTSVCTVEGNVVTFVASGSCVISANQAGNDDYLAAPEVTQTIAVGAGTQAINFTSTIPTNAVVGGPTYAVSATGGGSGQAVTFSVTSTSICSISAGVVTFLAAGDCVVEANQAGTANWNAASAATQTITVGKGTQVILFTSTAPTNAVVDGSAYTVSAAGGQSGESVVFTVTSPSVCSIANGVVSFLTVGDCVVAANQDGNDDWNAALENTQTITVGKGEQVVAFTSVAPTGVRVGDSDYTPTATGGASTSAVVISVASDSSAVCSFNSGSISFNAVGSCVVELNQADDSNYVAATQVTQTITVAKGLQTITKTSTDPSGAVVDGASYTPTFTGGATGNAIVVSIASSSSAVCTLAAGEITFTGAGDCDYTVNQAGTANYEAAPELSYTISVGKGAQAISITSVAPSSAVVGGTTYTPTATGGATGNNVSFRVDTNTASVCAMSMGVVRFVGVGICTILANQAGNANYLAAPQESQTFSVAKGAQTIDFTSAVPNAVVDGATYTPAATGGATGNTVTFSIAASSSSVCTLAFGRISFQNVGTCEVEANQLGNTNYNAAAQVVQSITVGKGAQVISFTSVAPSARVGGTTYSPMVSGGASGNAVTLSIAPSSSAICSVSNGEVSFQTVGSCVVEANQATSANYEAAAQVTQTITVAKGTQVLNFTSTPPSLRPVQGTTYVPTVTFGNSGSPVVFSIGAEAASICSISNGTISFLAVGDCVLHADQAGTANYTAATRITQTFDITKGEQIVTITSTAPNSAVVDGTTYNPTGTGGAGTSPIVFSATAESAGICSVFAGIVYFDGAGDCVIALNQAGDTNYNAATQKLQTITVGKGTQVITFTSTNTTATVDGATYTPTYTDGEGINSVQISVLSSSSQICEVNAGVVSFHAVGACVIEATQAGDNNYEAASAVSQTISVAKGNQATLVGHSSLSSLTLGNSTPTAVLSTTGGSGIGSVSWSVTPETAAYCSISGDVVSGLASGYCDLVATKLGDDNYLDAIANLSITVSTGGQTPVRTSVSNSNPTFSQGLTLDLSLAGGDGDGAVWYESLTTHVCNTDGGTTLNIYHAGTCTVIGHKDGDDNYDAVANTLSFEIAKATQTDVTIHTAQALTYSPDGAVNAALSLEGVLASGTQSFSVTSGSCTIVDGTLSATEAGDCEVTASILGDDKYLDGTFTRTFSIAKAAQATVTATLATNAPPAIAWNGTKVTSFNVAGGSGPVSLTASTTTPTICSVALEGTVVTITGIAQGTCDVSVTNAASANFLAASELFTVAVLDLASPPTSVAATAPARNNGEITSTISWVAPSAVDTRATVTGYKVQSSVDNGTTWFDVEGGAVDVASTSLSVALSPWSKYNFRVAATSDLDGETLNWAYFDLAGDSVPDLLPVGGGEVVLSTTKAATTSGEVVYVTGEGFEAGYTTRVELTAPSQIFTAGLRPAALVQTKVVNATFISPTRLSFILPKITLPKGVTSLTTQIKVLSTDNLRSDPIPLDYIPKKLAQAITVTGLPVTKTVLTLGNALPTGLVTSTGVTPVVTATPANVCTAVIVSGVVTVSPIGRGTCTVSVQAPVTPAYTASTAKVYSYTIKGALQSLTFANPGTKTWSATPLALVALSSASLAATFTSKTPTVCTVSGASLTMVKAGTCSITATQLGDSVTEPVLVSPAHTQTFTINKADRTPGLTATTENVSATGERSLETFNSTSLLGSQTLDVVIGDSPIEIPVTLNKREGTVLFTVDADSEKNSRCVADAGDAAGLIGAITLNDVGTCRVTISLPSDAAWNALLEPVVIVINVVERPQDTPAAPYSGDGEVDNSFKDLNPKDPDTEDAVAVALSGDAPAITLGGEEGLAYNAATGTFTFKSTSALVGTWKVTMTAPTGQLWFKTKGKVVKKVQQYVQTNTCVTTLTVKKDAKLKKRITRIIGAGCVLNDAGKSAFGTAPQKVIKIKYQRTRQYAKTGLSYVLKGKLKTRVLKPVKRTIVLKIGRVS